MSGTQQDHTPHDGRRPWRSRVPLSAIAALLLVGGVLLAWGISRQHPSPPQAVDKGAPSAASSPASGKAEPAPGRTQFAAMPASAPVRVTIPSLKVSSGLERLGLGEDRAMETPRDPAKAGWYTPGPAPGSEGPSVIAGHVTWNGAPAVFFELATLDPGDRIDVTREDGRTAEFTVDRVAVHPKDRFPTVEVYRNLDHAGLRLITCGGKYSRADSHYADNVVVYATLTGEHT
ncbi:class F sortase [Streptomyces sp. NPDC059142]|uniref:class F sortase n=1 Tax=Streptomyces sp. NPDC059142 TaxID=3346739 RepID=UPI0036B626A5